jgi:hypothetical protein
MSTGWWRQDGGGTAEREPPDGSRRSLVARAAGRRHARCGTGVGAPAWRESANQQRGGGTRQGSPGSSAATPLHTPPTRSPPRPPLPRSGIGCTLTRSRRRPAARWPREHPRGTRRQRCRTGRTTTNAPPDATARAASASPGGIEARWSERGADALRLSGARRRRDPLQLEPEGSVIDVRLHLRRRRRAVIVAEHDRPARSDQPTACFQDAFNAAIFALRLSVDVGRAVPRRPDFRGSRRNWRGRDAGRPAARRRRRGPGPGARQRPREPTGVMR